MRDANYKVVSEATVTTDEYGTASTDFALPSGGLTGRYTIQGDFGINASVNITVEEYKRPTFQVEFPKINQRYRAATRLWLRLMQRPMPACRFRAQRSATRLSAVSRCGGAIMHRLTLTVPEDVLVKGEAVTDADGASR